MKKENEKKLNDLLFTMKVMKDTCKIAVANADSFELVTRALEDLKNLEEVEEIIKKHYETDIYYELVNYHNHVMNILDDEIKNHSLIMPLKNARVRIADYFENKFLKHERR